MTDTQIEDYRPLIEEKRQRVSPYQEKIKQGRGDPNKAALAMIKAVDSDNPPIRLALGTDAVKDIESALEFIKAGLDSWRSVSMSTDFDEVAANEAQLVPPLGSKK